MFLTFLRHGGVAALLVGAAIEAVAFLLGWIAFRPLLIVLGALMFYLSEYGMHRFAFHAPPLSWPVARKLQHRLHYDHHVEPSRLDLLFLPIWFLVPNLAVATLLFALIFGAEASASALFGMMLAILQNGCTTSLTFPTSRGRALAAGSSSTICAITSSARSTGSASAIPRSTAFSGRFADPTLRRRALPRENSIRERDEALSRFGP